MSDRDFTRFHVCALSRIEVSAPTLRQVFRSRDQLFWADELKGVCEGHLTTLEAHSEISPHLPVGAVAYIGAPADQLSRGIEDIHRWTGGQKDPPGRSNPNELVFGLLGLEYSWP